MFTTTCIAVVAIVITVVIVLLELLFELLLLLLKSCSMMSCCFQSLLLDEADAWDQKRLNVQQLELLLFSFSFAACSAASLAARSSSAAKRAASFFAGSDLCQGCLLFNWACRFAILNPMFWLLILMRFDFLFQ